MNREQREQLEKVKAEAARAAELIPGQSLEIHYTTTKKIADNGKMAVTIYM